MTYFTNKPIPLNLFLHCCDLNKPPALHVVDSQSATELHQIVPFGIFLLIYYL